MLSTQISCFDDHSVKTSTRLWLNCKQNDSKTDNEVNGHSH